MINYLRKDRWSPYIVGTLIGILLTLLFAFGYQFGVSSGIARIGALLKHSFSDIKAGSYFGKALQDQIILNWKMISLIGLLLGSLVASKMTKGEIPEKNQIWKEAFGTSKAKRYFAAFIGGALILFGARIANGCTSGHAISGGAQLSITSWVFMFAVFAAAIPVSFTLYRKVRRS
ncbi:MAG: YeeE/YedE family protein [Chlamydiia bacterium]|nr:YeeE/YedE family protein [Chlamydiia bacterium]